MNTLKLGIVLMFAANILLLGMEAGKVSGDPGRAELAPGPERPPLPQIVMRIELPEKASPETLSMTCYSVGPFESGQTARAISDLLSQNGLTGHGRKTEAFVDRGYWVYLPAYESALDARKALDALHGADLDDIGLIRDGEFGNSISLGFFIKQANAIARREQVTALGFPARMRVQREDESRYWVDYQRPANEGGRTSNLLDDLVPAELHREMACGIEAERSDSF